MNERKGFTDLRIGDRVRCTLKNGTHSGTLKYLGLVPEPKAKGIFAGVELDEPVGLHNGKDVFEARPNHGIFVRPKNCKKIGVSALDSLPSIRRSLPSIRKREMLPGLRNLGNTCFFNSVVQQLAYSPAFRDALSAEEVKKSKVGELTDTLAGLFEMIDEKNDVYLDPSGLFSQLIKRVPMFGAKRQQDALELLKHLLEFLEIESKKGEKTRKVTSASNGNNDIYPNIPSWVFGVFGGKLSSVVRCHLCGHETERFEDFMEVSTPVPLPSSTSNSPLRRYQEEEKPVSLIDCLKEFTMEEQVSGYRCEACQGKLSPSSPEVLPLLEKKILFHSLPKVLVVHLKRYRQHPSSRLKVRKVNTKVQAPEIIDISEFTCSTRRVKSLSPPDLLTHLEPLPTDSLVSGTQVDCRDRFGMWLPAEIHSRDDSRIVVHFPGWDKEWNESIFLHDCKYRLAKFRSLSHPPSEYRNNTGSSWIGQRVRVYSKIPGNPRVRPSWYFGDIIKINQHQVLVDFDFNGKGVEYWFHSTSPEIVTIPSVNQLQAQDKKHPSRRPLTSSGYGKVANSDLREDNLPAYGSSKRSKSVSLSDSDNDEEVFKRYKADRLRAIAAERNDKMFVDIKSSVKSPSLYRLCGLISHGGSMGGGHYVSYIRVRENGKPSSHGKWHYFSDTRVREVDDKDVWNKQAYMYFYEAIKG